MTLELTENIEDYLLEIFLITQEKKVARAKDISKRRKVKMPSVANALKNLKEKGLVEHEKYGYIELTENGLELAKKLYERHKITYSFLHEILGVDERIAEKDAHKIEHYLHPKTLKKITDFMKFLQLSETVKKAKWHEHFIYFSKNGVIPDDCDKDIVKGDENMKEEKKLGKLKKGSIVRVVRIISNIDNSSVKGRLMSMGIVPGAEIKVEKIAPLGDPIDILVKGYHLSLRKEEANQVIVEEIL
jgi:DtxR family Mn-dependent transcriptional regulator